MDVETITPESDCLCFPNTYLFFLGYTWLSDAVALSLSTLALMFELSMKKTNFLSWEGF